MRWYEGGCAVCQRQNPGVRQDSRSSREDTQPEPEVDPVEKFEAVRSEELCYGCEHTYLDRPTGREEARTSVPLVQGTVDLSRGDFPTVTRHEIMADVPLPMAQGAIEPQEGLCSLPQPSSHSEEIRQRLRWLAERARALADDSSGSDGHEVLEQVNRMEDLVSGIQMAVCNEVRR